MNKLTEHFEKAARHHERIADEHVGLHDVHKHHAKQHEDDGEVIKAAHHRTMGTHHAQLAKLHKAHSEHCSEIAKALDGSDVSVGDTLGPKAYGDSLAKIFGE